MGRVVTYTIIAGLVIWLAIFLSNLITNDPFGATERTQIQSNAAIETARLQSQAQADAAYYEAEAEIEVANAEAHAQIQSAQAAAAAQKVQAHQRRRSSQTWARIMPILLIILAAGGALWLVIIYRGRTLLVLAERGALDNVGTPFLPTPNKPWGHYLPKLDSLVGKPGPESPESALVAYAAHHNQSVHEQNGIYLLIDKQSNRVVRRLAPRQ